MNNASRTQHGPESFGRLTLALVLSAAAHALVARALPQLIKPYDEAPVEFRLTVALGSVATKQQPREHRTVPAAQGAGASRLHPLASAKRLPLHEEDALRGPVRNVGYGGPGLFAADIARSVSNDATRPDPATGTVPAELANAGKQATASSNSASEVLYEISPSIEPQKEDFAIPLLDYYYASREVDQPATAIGDALLRYPPEALKSRTAGEVNLRLYIDESGVLVRAEVVAANPPGIFEQAALEAVGTMRFSAARKGQRAVRSQRGVQITFDPDPPVLTSARASR